MAAKQFDWLAEDGDNTLSLDWHGLDENSLIWEVGGYKGRWAKQMAEKYDCRIHFFEPQQWAIDKAKEELAGCKAEFFNYGLWTHRAELLLGDFGRDGASLLKPEHTDRKSVLVVDIDQFVYLKDIEEIDVCLVNIEGGEFVLIPYMIGIGLMAKINYFWAQFHLFVPGSDRKFEAIKRGLAMTHDLIWDCGSTAMAWKRREM